MRFDCCINACPPVGRNVGAMLSGMLILMVPAFLLCAGIALLAYRKRNKGSAD